jgi:hypothetical protein
MAPLLSNFVQTPGALVPILQQIISKQPCRRRGGEA